MHVFIGDGQAFPTALLGVDAVVTSYEQPNFLGTRLPVPSNLNLHQWKKNCVSPDDHLTLQYLQFGFPVGYEGPVLTHTFHNDPSAVRRVIMDLSWPSPPPWGQRPGGHPQRLLLGSGQKTPPPVCQLLL